MKFSLAILAASVFGASAVKSVPANGSIKANSELGMKLLSKARNLADNGDDEFTWIAGYSLKFQGCHHVQQWNDAADGDEDVKVLTKRLVRFRLCPSDTCSATKAAGCTGGYGDYVIDMNTYVDAYLEATKKTQETACENYDNSGACVCENDGSDDWSEEKCKYDCYSSVGMTYCADGNPYEEDGAADFEIDKYLECAQYKNNRRNLADAQDALYIGPYCAEQGGSIYMGVFTDDTCTEYADDTFGKTTFKELTGVSLPYSEQSLVGMECFSCVETEANNNDNANDAADGDSTIEQCENVYAAAGKCETNLPSGMVSSPNTNGCTYIDGIKIIRNDGLVQLSKARASPVATAFIVIFAMAFAAMGFYVWYLRQRLGVKKDTLM